jgi:hypothetical protein
VARTPTALVGHGLSERNRQFGQDAERERVIEAAIHDGVHACDHGI